MDFGVFYTCYTEKKAVDYSLEVLYGIYPDVPVYLISDGGSDYSDLEERYSSLGFNLKTHLEVDSRGLIPTFAHREDFNTEEIQQKVFDSVITFIERIKRAIDYSKKEFLLVMEPDVLVRGKISNPGNHKLLGSRVLRKLCRADRRFANYDFMFAVLFALIGIPESINDEIVECFRNPHWETTWHPLVHQYRAKYPLSTDGYDGTHIVNKNGMGDQWQWGR